MRASWALAIGVLLLGFAASGHAQAVEVPADQRLAVLRRVIATRQSQLGDTTRVDRCSAEGLIGAVKADSLAAEGLAAASPDFRCTPLAQDLPPATWVGIASMRVRPDALIEVDLRAGFTCAYRREEVYLVERSPSGMVVREIRIHGWASQTCSVRVPHLPR